MARSPKDDGEIVITPLKTGHVRVAVLGESPLIFHRMSEKAKRDLLVGSAKKTAAQRIEIKHDPVAEYRQSVYRFHRDDARTRLFMPAGAFKGAMATAALDLPGTKRTEIQRLVYVEPNEIPVFGIPKLFMTTVRSADINRTPDVRTRAIVHRWAAILSISYVEPKLTRTAIANLLDAAGIVAGVGDDRQEKGHNSHGRFRIVGEDDPNLQQIVEEGGRDAQDEALKNFDFADEDSRSLFDFYQAETARRGRPRLVAA